MSPLERVSISTARSSAALSVLANCDLVDAAIYPTDDARWTPLTIQFAARLRELDRQCSIWDEEPELIRGVLDGVWR